MNPDARRLSCAITLTSFSLLLWEILLTRLYGVFLYYTFAFVVVSLAMLGLTIGAVWVSFQKSADEEIPSVLSRYASQTSLGIIFGVFVMIFVNTSLDRLPFTMRMIFYFSLSVFPLVAAGKFLCLALTRREGIPRLYAANLLGAGLACALAGVLLYRLGGPAAALAAAVPAALASLLLSNGAVRRRRFWGLGFSLLATILVFWNPGKRFQVHSGTVPADVPIAFERWNAFSRVAVYPVSFSLNWGISPRLANQIPSIEQFVLDVDHGSLTPLMRFNGQLPPFDYLKHDITAFAHALRPGSKSLIIGAGGGRDVLAALVYGQPEIHAAEINPAVLEAVNNRFGDFTGHLDRLPQVRFVVSEGRKYVERLKERFGVMVITLVDTESASAAGAYAFVENGLYTVESWKTLLSHLTPGGILSVTRWYYAFESWPVHIVRACVLGLETLRQMGVSSPEKCLVVLRLPRVNPGQALVGTILISPQPFSESDLAILEEKCRISQCEIAYSWKSSTEPRLRDIILSSHTPGVYDQAPLDISATTDDRPFFQFYDRLPVVFKQLGSLSEKTTPGGQILGLLLVSIMGLSFILIGLPLIPLVRQKVVWSKETPVFVIYFSAIGLAYLFVELALIQRFSLFLGNPGYGFTVILFSLLASSAVGSLVSAQQRPQSRLWITLVIALGLFQILSKYMLPSVSGAAPGLRILLTLLCVTPLGYMMGFFLPWGLEAAQARQTPFTIWYWSINGAVSAMACVLGIVCLIAWGASITLGIAAGLYGVSGLLLTSFLRQKQKTILPPSEEPPFVPAR